MRLRSSVTTAASALALCAVMLATPLLWRLLLWASLPAAVERPSYLPALELSRPRYPFRDEVVADLRRYPPGLVTIGDSMAGRIDTDTLARLSGQAVSPLVENSTGPAYWYLVFKNYVIASGAHPDWIVIFFRDTNLTDVMFRIDGAYRSSLDAVAQEREDDLNRVLARAAHRPWHTLHELVDETYKTRRVREWLTPLVSAAPARAVAFGSPDKLLEMVNRAFALDKLRPMAQADIAAVDAGDADFSSHVDASVLPLMLDLARAHRLHVCFVRVLRRPVDAAPPPESAALQRYVVDLRRYIEAQGGVLLDDRDDPMLARLPYADGDHIARDARVPYTERFWARLSKLHP